MRIDISGKTFGDKHVLGPICFDLEIGKVSVLLGPSGCGKTTLLNMVSKAYFKEKRIAMVFQEPRLLPWLSVRDNLELVNPVLDIEGLVEEVGITDALDLPAAKLSLGMARRVAFVRALSIKPDLLIMDEPFVSLDAKRADSLRLMVLEMMEKHHCTTLFVTHDVREAVQLGDHLYRLGGCPSVIQSHQKIDLTPAQRRDPDVLDQQGNVFALS